MSVRTKQFYEFGPFLLDRTERLLLLEGIPVLLTPKAFDTLLALVESGGQVVEKEELMQRIWPDSFVEEANLAVNISMLRKALGERPGGGPYIETLPRRGYRFASPVKESWAEAAAQIVTQHVEEAASSEGAAQNPQRQPITTDAPAIEPKQAGSLIAGISKREGVTIIAIVVAAVAVAAAIYLAYFRPAPPQTRRLAVLPFKKEKSDADTFFLGFSLADGIITKLGYVKSLVIVPSSYVAKYDGQEIDHKKVAEELNVDTLLTGRYVKEGEDLRVTVQLEDVTTNRTIWGETIDGKYQSPELQDYVVRQVIKGLRLNLTAAEDERARRDLPDNPVAYEYFLRGQYLISTNKHGQAIELLKKAVELDQNYALAWAYLGKAYSINALQYFGGRADLINAEAYYEQALQLNPELFEARCLLANLFTETGRVEQAVPRLRQVVEADPNVAYAHWELSYAYRYAGMLKVSIEEGERALQLDANLKSHLFNSYLYAGQYDRFLKSLPAKDDYYVVFYRGLAYYYLDDATRAAVAFDRAYELNPKSVISQIGKALRLAIAGQNREAVAVLKDAESRIERGGAADGEIIYKVAQGYSLSGDKGSALRALGRSIERGFFCHPYFISDPLLAKIRGEAEYTALMEKARSRHEEFRRKFF